MSQDSLVVADGTGAAVRSALNSALNTLANLNAGPTAPSTTQAYMLWFDTTALILKIRNQANSAWIPLFGIDGALKVNPGLQNQSALLQAADLFSDWVVSGLLGSVPGPVSLTMTTPAGTYYAIGQRVVSAGFSFTYTASKDTYDDISSSGVVTHTAVTNGAGAPSVAANSIRLQKVVTNGTQITGVTDLRPTTNAVLANIANIFTAMQTVSPDTGGSHLKTDRATNSAYQVLNAFIAGGELWRFSVYPTEPVCRLENASGTARFSIRMDNAVIGDCVVPKARMIVEGFSTSATVNTDVDCGTVNVGDVIQVFGYMVFGATADAVFSGTVTKLSGAAVIVSEPLAVFRGDAINTHQYNFNVSGTYRVTTGGTLILRSSLSISGTALQNDLKIMRFIN